MAVDISREATNVILDPEVSNEIITKAIEESAIMQLAPKMEIAGNGKKFQTITGDPVPEWVGETEVKPVGKFDFGTKEVEPYKMALIVPFSDEFRRDKTALYNECMNRLPKLFGPKFDATVMGTTAPGQNFDVLGGVQTVSLTPASSNTLYDQFVAVDELIGNNDGIMNGIALSPKGRSKVLAAKDGQGRPLFTAGVQSGTVNPILGANVSVKKGVYVSGSPAVLGLAGDFDNCAWGAVNSIQGSISDEATIAYNDGENDVTLHLWQRRQYQVRVGDYDCSSSTITSWAIALRGTPYEGRLEGATYTGNMRAVFVGSGLFEWKPMSFLAEPGDLYLNEANHVAMCQTQYPDVLSEFSWGDNGAYGNKRGDQSGQEASVHGYYDYPWDGILHYNGKADTPRKDWPLIMWPSNGGLNQRFTAQLQADGSYVLVNMADGRAIDVRGGKCGMGTEVILYERHGKENQRWKVARGAGENAPCELISAADPAYCLDVVAGADADGAALCTWTRHGGANQQWYIMENADGTWTIANNGLGRKLVLDCKGGGK